MMSGSLEYECAIYEKQFELKLISLSLYLSAYLTIAFSTFPDDQCINLLYLVGRLVTT